MNTTIHRVSATVLGIPSTGAARGSSGIWGVLQMVIVEVETADGHIGLGEAFAYGVPHAVAAVVNQTLAPQLLGEDARQIRPLTDRLFRRTHLFGRYGITTFAISGVETALWDLAGKRANMPLYELLGGAAGTDVPAYASLIRHPEGDSLITEETEAAVAAGYTMVKLHQNAPTSIALARDVAGDVPLTVDINCEWSPTDATAVAREMAALEILLLEEPVWPPEHFEGLAEVQANSGVALASGENLCTAGPFADMLSIGAVTYAQPSVTKVGGIGEFLKVAELCRQHGAELAPHSPYLGPGVVATLHLIAHPGPARWIEEIYLGLEASPFTVPVAPVGGTFTVPDGPGLGVTLNPDVVRDYTVAG